MDDATMRAKMWIDLFTTENHARGEQHRVTSRAEVYLSAGLEMEKVLDALKISRATWYRRVDALRGWEAENRAASAPMSGLEPVEDEETLGEWTASRGLDTTLTARTARETGVPDVPGAVEMIETTAQADVVIPHAPVDPTGGGLIDSRDWCRWCGHRVIEEGGGHGWVHHVSDGGARVEGIIDVPGCPGEQPWPASAEWPR